MMLMSSRWDARVFVSRRRDAAAGVVAVLTVATRKAVYTLELHMALRSRQLFSWLHHD